MKHLYYILVFFVLTMVSCGSYYIATHGRTHVVTSDTLDVERGHNYSYPNR